MGRRAGAKCRGYRLSGRRRVPGIFPVPVTTFAPDMPARVHGHQHRKVAATAPRGPQSGAGSGWRGQRDTGEHRQSRTVTRSQAGVQKKALQARKGFVKRLARAVPARTAAVTSITHSLTRPTGPASAALARPAGAAAAASKHPAGTSSGRGPDPESRAGSATGRQRQRHRPAVNDRRPREAEGNSTRRFALLTSRDRLYCVQGALGSRSGDGRQRCSRLHDVGPSNTARSS